MKDKFQTLFSMLLYYRHNIHMLHWKVVGPHFDCTHELMDSYVDKFNDFIDEVAEMMLSLDIDVLTLNEAISILSDLDQHIVTVGSKDTYGPDKVRDAIGVMFNDLYDMYEELIDDCDISECVSKLDEHKYWLRIELKYKNKQR